MKQKKSFICLIVFLLAVVLIACAMLLLLNSVITPIDYYVSDCNFSILSYKDNGIRNKISYDILMQIYYDNQDYLDNPNYSNAQKDEYILDKINDYANINISKVGILDYVHDTIAEFRSDLCDAEIDFIIDHPFATISFYNASNKAIETSEEYYLDGFYLGNADAFRHSYWNALMVKAHGYDLAKGFADAHEERPDATGIDKEMDLYNNEQGRQYGLQYGSLNDDALAQKILSKVSFGNMKRVVNEELVDTSRADLKREYIYNYTELSQTTVRIDRVILEIDGNISVDSEIYGKTVVAIGTEAFKDQTGLQLCTLPTTIDTIGANCFSGCTHITGVFANTTSISQIPNGTFNTGHGYIVYLPNNVTYIGDSALEGTSPRKLNLSAINTSSLTYVGNNAFKDASLNKMKVPTNATYIGSGAFQNANPAKTVYISNATNYVGSNAFASAGINVFYVEHSSKPSNWDNNWNSSNYPVVWGTNYSSDKSYVVSINKTSGSLQNISSSTSVPDPERDGYTFGGWYTTPDCTGTSYELYDAPNGTLYADWYIKQSSGGSCVAEGTLVTLANGTQVPVETLTGNERLLVWDMLNGTYSSAPILFVDSDPAQEYRIIELTFSDGTKVKVIDEHAFFDVDIQEYVFLREDASMFIGHHFNKGNSTVVLEDVRIYNEYTSAWSPVTRGALCYYVNGLLSMPGNTEGFINIFRVEDMRINANAMQQDIATYGLYTYEEFCTEVVEVPEGVFEAFNGQYLKVSFGKGLITKNEIAALFTRYSGYFIEEDAAQVQTPIFEQLIQCLQCIAKCLLKGLGLFR